MTDFEQTDDQYGPNSQDLTSETKTWAEIIRIAIDQGLRDMNVWLPCSVVRVRNNGFVDVQPELMENFRVQGVMQLPVLQNVPIQHPRGADYSIKLPVAAGDFGRVVFCDRSLDNWIVKGGVVDPNDVRLHDLSDGVFVPGLTPMTSVLAGPPDEMILKNGKAELHLQKAGTFLVKNQSNELLDLLDQLLEVLTTETFTITMLGPQPFISSTITLLQQIRDKLDTLKGS